MLLKCSAIFPTVPRIQDTGKHAYYNVYAGNHRNNHSPGFLNDAMNICHITQV